MTRTTGNRAVTASVRDSVVSTDGAVEVNANALRQVVVQTIVQATAPQCVAITID